MSRSTNETQTAALPAEEVVMASTVAEERLHAVVTSAPLVLFALDRNGIFTLSEGRGLAALGLKPGQVVGQSVFDLYRDYTEIIEANRRALSGETFSSILEIGPLVFESRYTPIRDAFGGVTGVVGVALDITKRTRAERALSESEERYRESQTRLDILNGIVTEVTSGTTVERIIASTVRKVSKKFPSLSVLYTTMDDGGRLRVIHSSEPGDPANALTDIARSPRYVAALRRGAPVIVEDARTDERFEGAARGAVAVLDVPLEHPAGLLGVLSFHAPAPHAWSAHEIATLRETAENLAVAIREAGARQETRYAVSELERSEGRLRALIDNSSDGVILLNAEGRVLYAGPSTSRILGYASEELEGRSLFALTHPDDIPSSLTRWSALQVGQSPSEPAQFRFRHKDGSWRWIEGVAKNLLEEPAVRAIVANYRDITERKTAEDAIRDSEARYRLLFERSPQPLWVYDRETLAFLAVNDAAIEHYGYSREEFLAMTIREIRPADELERFLAHVGKNRETLDRVARGRHLKKDGTVIEVEVISHGITFAGRPAQLVLTKDVTEQRRLERELRQFQKMEAIGGLAGGVAHDFNNILMVILGSSELLLSKIAKDNVLRREVEEIFKAGERAASLTHQLLAFSRRQMLHPRVLDLNEVLAGMRGMIQRLMGEDVELLTVLAPDLGAVKADPNQIEQVVLNLVVNARDAMANGGKLTVETANVELDAEYASRRVGARPGSYVMLAVSDTGMGMDPTTQAHLFEPFFTTKELGKGTGLGLSTVYGIVKQSNGYIWVYSELGHGTTFKVYLPRVAQAIEPMERSPAEAEAPRRGFETVLLVEDEDAVRPLLREFLEEKGYTVLEARDGCEALQLSERHRDRIHLLVTDVVMPEMGGCELAERLARERPEMKVLYMSGYTATAVEHRGALGLAAALLQKPFSAESFVAKVRELLDAPGRTLPRV